MDLDNARNAKAEIFREVFNFSEITVALTEGSGSAFVPQEDDRLTESFAKSAVGKVDARAQVAIGVSQEEGRGGGDRHLVALVQDENPATSELVARMADIAKGELTSYFVGPIRAQSHWRPARRRPICPGISIGHPNITAGTLGGFIQIRNAGRGIVSNNHVLADVNAARRGDAIWQPGRADGGRSADAVAKLKSFVPIRFGARDINYVDCASATIDSGVEVDFNFPRDNGPIPKIAGVRTRPSQIHDQVQKTGRTTGHTTGEIFAIDVDNLSVDFGSPGNPRLARFDNQIQIASPAGPFSQGGDSGSLILDSDARAAALLFAGSEFGGPFNTGTTSANPIQPVLDALLAQILTG